MKSVTSAAGVMTRMVLMGLQESEITKEERGKDRGKEEGMK